jgi:ubiquitin carboxyl-terminal hydrolase MINDY-1/2
LILRGDIQILPRTRHTVSYEFLSQLVAEYLLSSSPDMDISAALSIMPYIQSTLAPHNLSYQLILTLPTEGMDLNPLFTSATTFRPSSLVPSSSGAGGELALFLLSGIPLVHGWLVDPDSPAARAMMEEGTEDYDSAVGLIAEADHLTGGLLVQVDDDVREGEAGPSSGGGAGRSGGHSRNGKGPRGTYTQEERRKVRNGGCSVCTFVSSFF